MEILKRIFVAILVVTFALSAAPMAAFADTGDAANANVNKDLLNKVDRLENRLKQLEMKPTGAEMAAPAYVPPSGGGFLKAAEDIQISGYLNTEWNINTNLPSTGALNGINSDRAGVNQLRSFDRNHNSFVVNALDLTLEKKAPETGGIGFRADLIFGEDAKFLNAATQGIAAAAHSHGLALNSEFDDDFEISDLSVLDANDNNQSNVNINQAYIELMAPYGNGIDFYFGKFVTLLGVETIDPRGNWLASRGLIFNYGIPFTHTGVRATYNWNDKFKTVLGVNNGADQDIDNNVTKSAEAQMVYKLTDRITLTQNLVVGEETPSHTYNGHNGETGITLDTIAGIKLTDKWSSNLESVWGKNGVGDWYGIGVWNRYEFNDWISFNHRFEWFNDSSGGRLGFVDLDTCPGGCGYDAYEMTFGMDFKVYQNLLTRLEYRFDRTPGTTRFDVDTNTDQSTFLASLVYSF